MISSYKKVNATLCENVLIKCKRFCHKQIDTVPSLMCAQAEIPFSFLVWLKGIYTKTTTRATTMSCGVRWMSLLLCCLSHDARRDATRRDKCANQQVGEENHKGGQEERKGAWGPGGRATETKRKQAAYIISTRTHTHTDTLCSHGIQYKLHRTVRKANYALLVHKCLSLHTHTHTPPIYVCIFLNFTEWTSANVIKTKTNRNMTKIEILKSLPQKVFFFFFCFSFSLAHTSIYFARDYVKAIAWNSASTSIILKMKTTTTSRMQAGEWLRPIINYG